MKKFLIGILIVVLIGVIVVWNLNRVKRREEVEDKFNQYSVSDITQENVKTPDFTEEKEELPSIEIQEPGVSIESDTDSKKIGYKDYDSAIDNIKQESQSATVSYVAEEEVESTLLSESVQQMEIISEDTFHILNSIISQIAKREDQPQNDYYIETSEASWDGTNWYYEVISSSTGQRYKIVYFADADDMGGYLQE